MSVELVAKTCANFSPIFPLLPVVFRSIFKTNKEYLKDFKRYARLTARAGPGSQLSICQGANAHGNDLLIKFILSN